MTLTSGARLGPYEIIAPLGDGGMGEVYRARDTRLGRDAAVKVLPQHLSSSSPEVRARFEREARTVASLNHPHICGSTTWGAQGGEIADALERAHRAGIVHRDLNPGYVMLTKSRAKLMDFGPARGGAPDAAP